MDVKKASSLVDKTRIIETMLAKASQKNSLKQKISFSLKAEEQRLKTTQNNSEDKVGLELGDDLKLLQEAVEQLRLTAERLELDKQIASSQNVAA